MVSVERSFDCVAENGLGIVKSVVCYDFELSENRMEGFGIGPGLCEVEVGEL